MSYYKKVSSTYLRYTHDFIVPMPGCLEHSSRGFDMVVGMAIGPGIEPLDSALGRRVLLTVQQHKNFLGAPRHLLHVVLQLPTGIRSFFYLKIIPFFLETDDDAQCIETFHL